MHDQSPDVGKRLRMERERIGFSPAQFAVLTGVDVNVYPKFESGEVFIPMDYIVGLSDQGCSPQFIGMGSPVPIDVVDARVPHGAAFFRHPIENDGAFRRAVMLMRRSAQAVDVFLGEGMSLKSPELIAALMRATLQGEAESSSGDREDFADKIVAAIDALGETIRESRQGD